MKEIKTGNQADKQLDGFLSAYQDEELSAELQIRVLHNAMNSVPAPEMLKIAPLWKSLSLAASIAVFALGVIMSNQVFSSSTEYSDWSFGETGLYSYLVEGE
jgi:hypothetical protein